MQVIFNGVVMQASFSIVDDEGDTQQTVMVQPAQDKPDALKIGKLTKENFDKALQALLETRANLVEQVKQQAQDKAE